MKVIRYKPHNEHFLYGQDLLQAMSYDALHVHIFWKWTTMRDGVVDGYRRPVLELC